jgi:hypothetical protein
MAQMKKSLDLVYKILKFKLDEVFREQEKEPHFG